MNIGIIWTIEYRVQLKRMCTEANAYEWEDK